MGSECSPFISLNSFYSLLFDNKVEHLAVAAGVQVHHVHPVGQCVGHLYMLIDDAIVYDHFVLVHYLADHVRYFHRDLFIFSSTQCTLHHEVTLVRVW